MKGALRTKGKREVPLAKTRQEMRTREAAGDTEKCLEKGKSGKRSASLQQGI